MKRVAYLELEDALTVALGNLGFAAEPARTCARLFAETTRDGVYTHGLARFPRFSAMVRTGVVDPGASACMACSFGAMERWHGHRGAGNLNAARAMGRAVEIARDFGVGAVFLADTNHWMRGGSYAWQAADAECLSICWTNTMPNLPPWGAAEPAIGNNPLVMGAPRRDGAHVVLDMAMSQFSYGALAGYALRGEALPVPGGFDGEGRLTTDAAAIEASGAALPIGYWKGSGLAVMLDLFAAMLGGGLATWQIEPDAMKETGLSQVFLAFYPAKLNGAEHAEAALEGVMASLAGATPANAAKPVRYPGEETLRVRRENLTLGVPVDETLWAKLLAGEV